MTRPGYFIRPQSASAFLSVVFMLGAVGLLQAQDGDAINTYSDATGDVVWRSDLSRPYISGDPENPIEFGLDTLAMIDMVSVSMEVTADGDYIVTATSTGDRKTGVGLFGGLSVAGVGEATLDGVDDVFDGNASHFFNFAALDDSTLGTLLGTVDPTLNEFVITNNPVGVAVSFPNDTTTQMLIDGGLFPESWTWSYTQALIALLESGDQFVVADEVGLGRSDSLVFENAPPAADCDLDIGVLPSIAREGGKYAFGDTLSLFVSVVNNSDFAVDDVKISTHRWGMRLRDSGAECTQPDRNAPFEECDIGRLEKDESRTVELKYELLGIYEPGNQLQPFSNFGYLASAYKDGKSIESRLFNGVVEEETMELLFRALLGAVDLQTGKNQLALVDLHLDDIRIADDIDIEKPQFLSDVSVRRGLPVLDVVEGGASDNSSPLARVEIDLLTREGAGLSDAYAVILTRDQAFNTTAVAVPDLQFVSPDATQASLAIAHANASAPGVDLLIRSVDGPVAERLVFGDGSEYLPVAPGLVNLNVAATDGSTQETFRFSTNAGEAYLGILGPAETGKTQQAFTFEVISGGGQLVDTFVSTAAKDDTGIPDRFALHQNYPNPFNPSTLLGYALPEQSIVSVSIYDTMGRLVKRLVETERPAGRYTVSWNGSDARGQLVASGVYYYKLEAGDFAATRKMVYAK